MRVMWVGAARWGRLERKARAHDRAREVIARGLGAIPDSFSLLLEAATLERVVGNHGTAREMAARADEASEPPRSSSLPQQILGALYGTTSPAFAPGLLLSLVFAHRSLGKNLDCSRSQDNSASEASNASDTRPWCAYVGRDG